MDSLLYLVNNKYGSISEAVTVNVNIVVKNREKYPTSTLCRYCQNILLNHIIKSGSTIDFTNSKLAKAYGICQIIINKCDTEADDFQDALVTYKTIIVIDMIQSQDFYTLKRNFISISLGGVETIVEKLCSLIQLNKGCKSLPHCPIGILLHGPSGCGKSSLGKYLAQKCDAILINIEESELLHQEYGSGAIAMKNIFNRAVSLSREGFVILFLDELDMLCPCDNNANVGSKQITNALVTEMDNLHIQNITGLLVLGATTSLSNISSSLRRPGRFDHEILVNVPSKEQRTSILEVLSVNMLMESDISLSDIALWTPGYVGSDLRALCEEAVNHSLSIIPNKSTIGKTSFLYALHKVTPSLRRCSNYSVDLQQVNWEDIGGLEEVKAEIKQSVEWPFLYPELLKSMDMSATKGVLLYGAPGCCKTTLVRAAATSCHVNFLTLNGAQIYSPYVGESERILSETFQKARALSPCILFFDELESLVGKRTSSGKQSCVQERILSTMLNEMDGIGVKLDQKVEFTNIRKKDHQVKTDHLENSNLNFPQKCNTLATVIVIGATNRPDMIDSAILRPGRMDKLIYVPPPDEQSRRSILKLLTSKMPTENLDIHELSSKTEHFSGADLKNLCNEAGLICLRENPSNVTVQQTHFMKALSIINPSHYDGILQQYARFKLK